jgi:chromosome segregation ATPase
MTTAHRPRLALREELARSRARMARLAEEESSLRAALDQAELRMLMAETPLADRDRSLAVARLRAAERDLAALERRLRDLEREWARLAPEAETAPGAHP